MLQFRGKESGKYGFILKLKKKKKSSSFYKIVYLQLPHLQSGN